MNRFRTLLPLIVIFALAPTSIWAAKLAKVDADQAELREGPEDDSNVIMTLSKGRWLATSNMPVRGFYKVRTNKGVVGWVASSDIVLLDPAKTPTQEESPSQ